MGTKKMSKHEHKNNPPERVMKGIAGIIMRSSMYEFLDDYGKKKVMDVLTGSDDMTLNLEWRLAWSITATLSFAFNTEDVEHFDDGVASSVTPSVSVSWSSTGRNISEAYAAINLYKQVIDLGCLIEVYAKERRVYIFYPKEAT